MVIQNGFNALNAISNASAAGSQTGTPSNASQEQGAARAMDRATLSTAGTGISQASGDADVRWDKVASIQKALADGTYNVPASAVASSMVDAMLGGRS